MTLKRPSPGTAIALLALLVASAPNADAASRAVKRALSADNAKKVGGVKVSKRPKPRHLLPLDGKGKFPASVLPAGSAGSAGPAGPQGPAGPAGKDGADGANGANGANGATSVKIRLSPQLSVPANDGVDLTAACEPGERAVGGGARMNGTPDATDPADSIMWSFPGVAIGTGDPVEPYTAAPPAGGETPTAWRAFLHNPTGNPVRQATVYAVCAAP
jgi:hypothetical protein